MTKVFKAAIGLKQQTKKAIVGTMPAYCTVSAVNGALVQLTMDGDSEPSGWYPSSLVSLAVGTRGVIQETQGGGKIFIPLGISHPLGVHHYDKGGGVQVGDTDPANIAADTTGFVAIGLGASVGGVNAVAVGRATSTTGLNSVVVGYGSSAGHAAVTVGIQATTGSVATAVGYWSHADGDNATALGREAEATGMNTTAVGYAAKATGERATALGTSSLATGMRSIAIGYASVANLDYAMAIGYDATSTNRSIAIGTIAKTTGAYSTALGYGAEAGYATSSTHGELALGRNATAKTARAIAIGHGATTQYHYEARIKARGLIIESSQDGSNITKIGLHSSNGTRYYLYVTDAGVLTTTTSW